MTDHEELVREHERLSAFLYLVPVGLALVDSDGEVALMNAAGAQLLMPLADGKDLTNLFDVLDPYDPELRGLARREAPPGMLCEGRRIDLRAKGKGLAPRFLAVGLVRVDAARVMAIVQDITRTVEQERAIFASEQRFKAICEGMRDAVICTLDSAHLIDSWNASGERLLGYVLDEVAGQALDGVLARGDPLPYARALQLGWSDFEGWNGRKDGRRFWGEGVLSTLNNEAGAVSGFSVVLLDVTERKLASERLLELASKDALTGLANRKTFQDHAGREFARRARYATPCALLMIDADHFKRVNDTHGHAAGDEVLRALAAVLKSSVRTTDLPARFGGEEFVVLLPETTAAGALVLATRICAAIADSEVAVDGKTLRYTVSIGVAAASPERGDLTALLAAADAALYRAKAEGRNRAILA